MEPIGMEVQDGIAVLRLQHGKASAMDVELCRALVRRMDDCAAQDVRAVILTGTGAIFSAGVDLIQLTDGGDAYASEFVPLLVASIRALFSLEKPLVAAVNGHAVAGGCIMACAADLRLMAEGTGRIGVPELLVGVPFPTAALEILRFTLPPQHVQPVIFGGQTYLPEEAQRLGLIDELVVPEYLEESAIAEAHRLALIDPHVFAVTKRQLRAATLHHIALGAQAFDTVVFDIWRQPETRERVRTYIERTFRRRQGG
jgi:enoyl-CoA hydratase